MHPLLRDAATGNHVIKQPNNGVRRLASESLKSRSNFPQILDAVACQLSEFHRAVDSELGDLGSSVDHHAHRIVGEIDG